MSIVSQLAEPMPVSRRALWILGILLVLAVLFLKLTIAGSVNLRSDEAYVWAWSEENALSFLDHPPMTAWLARLGTAIFGHTLIGVRLPMIVAVLLAELLLADIVRRRTGSLGAALSVIVMMEASVYFGVLGAMLEPSVPMILFLSLMYWALCRLEESDDGRWWLLVGIAAGFALLSKYIALLLAPAVLLFLLASRRNRRWLATPWPWLAGVLTIAVFSPVLIWNGLNDWASFRFQGDRVVDGEGPDLKLVAEFAAISLVGVGPLLAPLVGVGAVVAGWRAARQGNGTTLALAGGFLIVLAYLTLRSFTLTINTTWPVVMWPFAIAAMAIMLAAPAARWWRRLTIGAVVVSALLVAVVDWHLLVNTNPVSWTRDPIGRDDGYDVLARTVEAQAEATGAQWIATSDRRTTAQLRWHLDDKYPVLQLDERSRYIDFVEPDVAGRIGLYVHIAGARVDAVDAVAGKYLTPLGSAERVWRGVSFGVYEIERIDGWTPDLSPPPTSPLFAWPDLV